MMKNVDGDDEDEDEDEDKDKDRIGDFHPPGRLEQRVATGRYSHKYSRMTSWENVSDCVTRITLKMTVEAF